MDMDRESVLDGTDWMEDPSSLGARRCCIVNIGLELESRLAMGWG